MSRGNLALRLPDGAPFAASERTALDSILGRASGEQRAWLAGFLAGLAARDEAAAPQADIQPAVRAAEPLLILYATESGNAEGIAAKLATAARRQGFKVTLKDVADSSPGEAAKAKSLLLVAATWGEGEPPSRAAGFYRALMAADAPRLEHLRFAVLGLGDRAYANFCSTGRELDARLEALGGTRVATRVDCDLDFAKPAAAWGEQVLAALRPVEPTSSGAEIIHLEFAPPAAAEPACSSPASPSACAASSTSPRSRAQHSRPTRACARRRGWPACSKAKAGGGSSWAVRSWTCSRPSRAGWKPTS